MKKKLHYLTPAFFLLLAALIVLKGLAPTKIKHPFDFDRFARLPVLDGGRFKPIDSVARTNLLVLRGKQYTTDVDGNKVSAREWFTRLTLDPHSVEDYPVFRIDHGDIKSLLGITDESRKYFSYAEIAPHLQQIDSQTRLINQDPKKRDAFEKAISTLTEHIFLYQTLGTTFRPHAHGQTVRERYDHFISVLKEGSARLHQGEEPGMDDPLIQEVLRLTQEFGQLSADNSIRFVPAPSGGPEWMHLSEALFTPLKTTKLPSVALAYAQLADQFQTGDYEQANQTLDALQQLYAPVESTWQSNKVNAEFAFNQIQPFIICIELYIVLFLAVVIGWATLSRRTLQAGFWILILAFFIHTIAMIARMWLTGRPPATNLYSSAITVGWITPLLGIALEWIYRNGIGSIMAAVTGFLSLIIAQHLMTMGDTMGMMRAVLDSNFWLTVHVITVIVGYAATFVAGFIAIAYLLLGIFTKHLTQENARNINRMVYGILCFGLLFSFFGTFSGGIWADQSWGRFWGWDPKENGALMIVIWNALILHARRCGMVKEKGMMLLAIGGNMITAWSWFGTNMLGVGLHSYGFMNSALFWLFSFWLSQLALISLGAYLPDRLWRSHITTTERT